MVRPFQIVPVHGPFSDGSESAILLSLLNCGAESQLKEPLDVCMISSILLEEHLRFVLHKWQYSLRHSCFVDGK
jgi:hypothetical protein